MKSSFFALTAASIAVSAALIGSAGAQSSVDNPSAIADRGEVTVNIDNFVRAANDLEIGKALALTGGVNRFFHFREPTPIDNQPVIRMNRDTLYSLAVVDISEGATLTLPDVGDRYISAMIVNQDHYINDLFQSGGTYELGMETFDTPYVIVAVRTLVDAANPKDIAAVNALQDQIAVEAGSSKPYTSPIWYTPKNELPVDNGALERRATPVPSQPRNPRLQLGIPHGRTA